MGYLFGIYQSSKYKTWLITEYSLVSGKVYYLI